MGAACGEAIRRSGSGQGRVGPAGRDQPGTGHPAVRSRGRHLRAPRPRCAAACAHSRIPGVCRLGREQVVLPSPGLESERRLSVDHRPRASRRLSPRTAPNARPRPKAGKPSEVSCTPSSRSTLRAAESTRSPRVSPPLASCTGMYSSLVHTLMVLERGNAHCRGLKLVDDAGRDVVVARMRREIICVDATPAEPHKPPRSCLPRVQEPAREDRSSAPVPMPVRLGRSPGSPRRTGSPYPLGNWACSRGWRTLHPPRASRGRRPTRRAGPGGCWLRVWLYAAATAEIRLKNDTEKTLVVWIEPLGED